MYANQTRGIFLYLKRLEIQGFKSFATRSVLDFEESKHVTAIVGPNGSGKSNIADGIRWVLGEQSYKAIRSKKSEDVIFAGSGGKNRGSLAKVSIILDNADGKAPIDFSEVEISRCVYRDGTGEYLINGKKSRLLDVVELLTRSGFGQSTYSVIGQGMVDAMLFYGPAERKVLFDEAAGVRQYEIKREQTLRKLEDTSGNVVRIKDVLSELNPRLSTLRRQTERAKEKDEVAVKLLEKQKVYFASLWEKLNHAEAEKRKDLEKITTEEAEIKNEITELDKKFNEALGQERTELSSSGKIEKELASLEEQKDALKQEIYTLRAQLAVSSQTSNLTKNEIAQKIADVEGNLKQISKDNLVVKIQKTRSEIAEKEKEQEGLSGEISENKSKLAELSKILSEFDFGVVDTKLRDILESQKKFLFELSAATSVQEIKLLIARGKEIEKSLSYLSGQVSSAGEGKIAGMAELQTELDDLTGRKEKISLEISGLRSKLFELEFEQRRAEERKDELKSELERLSKVNPIEESKKGKTEEEIAVKERSVSELEKKIQILRGKLREYSGDFAGQGKILSKIKDDTAEKQKLLSHYSQEITTFQVELAKIETKKQDLREEINRELSSEAVLADAKTIPELNPEEARAEIEKLKNKLYAIGEIDSEVESEFKEVSERVEFLSKQIEDLEKAKKNLEKLISELDGKIRRQFEDSFSAISKKFSHFFEVLFEGGQAKLELAKTKVEESNFTSDEALLDESEAAKEVFGIEISAVPPGKRSQSLNALSGGERTMTSLALLFAILSVNPSPFVVLDEVDAALDEANTKRFLKIIDELSAKTQFIFITHNRLTMEKANLLYGITMDESHASKMISVKLTDALKNLKESRGHPERSRRI